MNARGGAVGTVVRAALAFSLAACAAHPESSGSLPSDAASAGAMPSPPCASGEVMTRAVGCARVLQLAAGRNHTCARLTTGKVLCWGANGGGQLGDGSEEDSCSPVLVRGLDDAIDVAAGPSSACAVKRSGAVACWGPSERGRIEMRTIPGLGDAVRISVGTRHGCALRSNGSVACWGIGADDEFMSRELLPEVEVREIPWVSDAVDLRSDGSAVCALSRQGEVWCWGVSPWTNLDAAVFHVPPIADAVSLEMDQGQQCVRKGDGEIFCWRGGPGPDALSGKVTRMVGACALRLDGAVDCINPDANGVSRIIAGGATSIVVGRDHACALMDGGRTLCWGDDRYCAVGRPRPALPNDPYAPAWLDVGPVDW